MSLDDQIIKLENLKTHFTKAPNRVYASNTLEEKLKSVNQITELSNQIIAVSNLNNDLKLKIEKFKKLRNKILNLIDNQKNHK